MNITEEYKNAIEQTIEDFRIEYYNSRWWEFKNKKYLLDQISIYEEILKK